jgi:putative transposase
MPHLPSQAAGRGAARDARCALGDLHTDELVAAGITPGPELVAAVQRRIDAFADKYARALPAAVKCLLTDRAQLTSYLRLAAEYHRRIRHSNVIERTFGETAAASKSSAACPAKHRASTWSGPSSTEHPRGWRGMNMTTTGTGLLADLRRQLLDPPTQQHRTKIDTQPAAAPETVGAVA